ncbi:MAG: SUMF1/EgtB/PvdO family nonheme iron enzyme, partial [Roseimicrobium sp.]
AEFTSAVPTYTVQVISPHNSVSPAPASYTYEEGQTVTFAAHDVLGANTRRLCTGYSVSGAANQTGTDKSFSLAINGNITVTWNWKTQYLLAVATSGPGSVSTGAETWVDADNPTSVTATANVGAAFTSWSGDTAAGSANGTTFTIASMTRPVGPLTANFAIGMRTLTVASSQSTTTPAPGTHAYPYGSTVSFSAMANEASGSRQRPSGWTLTNSAPQNSSAPSGSFVITEDTTLTWAWVPEVLLTVSSGTEGVILPMNAAGWHALNSTIVLTASPAPWFSFRRWTGAVPAADANQATLSLSMDQPRAITADFAPLATVDGTPNWWLSRYANVTGSDYEGARLKDSDGDGRPAWQEFVEGMSDLNAGERFELGNITTNPGSGSLSFTVPVREGRVYQLLEGASLGAPLPPSGAPLVPTPPTTTVTVTLPANASRRFYAMQVALGSTSAADADPAAKSHAPAPGSLERRMVRIPAGAFIQGENSGPTTTRPEHTTHVSEFFMDKFEVTRADWEKVATWSQTHGYDLPITLPYTVPANHPAVAISWYDAVKWCNARTEMEGRRPVYFATTSADAIYRTGTLDLTTAHVNWAGDGYRLPTEAEWERASRGGLEQMPYSWGNAAGELRANHWDYQVINGRAPNEAYPYTERVGYFDGTQPRGGPDMANAFGLYDMAGNAWEWTWDRMGDYSADAQYNPRGPDTGSQRVQRGGAWWNYVDQATNFQRLPFPPNGSDDYGMIGFRCVRAAHPNE